MARTSQSGSPLIEAARQAARRAGIPVDIFLRQIQQESGFDPNARSSAGALGIAQIVPRWHPGVDPLDPYAALNYAAQHDATLLKKYGGDWRQVLSVYNSGRPDKWDDPGFAGGQTYNYVKNILGGTEAPVAQAIAQQNPSPWAGLEEAFYDPRGSYDQGRFGGPIGRHDTHVHASITDPQQMLKAIQLAQSMGLSARENPYTDQVDPVHTQGSYHYRNFPGTFNGRTLGQGLDVSGGTPDLLGRYYDTITGRTGGSGGDTPTTPDVVPAAPRQTMSATPAPQRRQLPAAVRQALQILRS